MPTSDDAERILAAARQVLAEQRAGGRRRAMPQGQWRTMRRARRQRRGRGIASAAMIVLVALLAFHMVMVLVGLVIGLAFGLIVLAVLAMLMARVWRMIGGSPRRAPLPTVDTLREAPLARVVEDTQRWLDAQRRGLPAPAARSVDLIGLKLDTLSAQIGGGADLSPELVGDIRRLVGEHLPGVVSAYAAVPAALRTEAHAGTSPDAQLAASLATIDGEIDALNRQLASGALDRLAVESRYLDMRYREGGSPA